MGENSKNSFRDMILIIFVVLVCFGITIYGIAYLTGKVFSTSPEVEVSENEKPKEVMTNPSEGDTLTFTSMNDTPNEVAPEGDNIRMTTTPPAALEQDTQEIDLSSNIVVEDNTDSNNMKPLNQQQVKQQDTPPAPPFIEPKAVTEQQQIKKEQLKQEAVKQQAIKPQVEKQQVKQEPVKKETVKKEPVKMAPPKTNANFVVQLLAVQSKASAEKEAARFRTKYPDVFITQVVINGKTWYRVRLGVSATKEEAQRIADKVAVDFKIQPKVTKNN